MASLFYGCSVAKEEYVPTKLESYIKYLKKQDFNKTKITYEEVVREIGLPALKKEKDDKLIATWQELYVANNRYSNTLSGKTNLVPRKLIIIFDIEKRYIIELK